MIDMTFTDTLETWDLVAQDYGPLKRHHDPDVDFYRSHNGEDDSSFFIPAPRTKARLKPWELSPLGRVAVAYVRAKFKVVPLPRRGKNPGDTLGNDWGSKALTTVEQVTDWWTQHPEHNVGIMAKDDTVILDVDCKNGSKGMENLRAMREDFGDLPVTLVAVTPSGGLHIHLKLPKGSKLSGATRAMKGWLKSRFGDDRKLDWDLKSSIGKAHVVVAPGSILDETAKWRKGVYRWLFAPFWMDLHLTELDWLFGTERGVMAAYEIADAPQWLLDLICTPAKDTSASQRLVPQTSHHPHGEEEMGGPRNYDRSDAVGQPRMTDKIRSMLTGVIKPGATPSDHFWATMVVMKNSEWAYADMKVEFLKESNTATWEHVSKDGLGQVEALIDREIIHHQQKFIEGATGAHLKPEFEALLTRIRSTAWRGRAGAVDRAVLTWCVEEAMRRGNTRISASSRTISSALKHDRSAVTNALHRLMDKKLIGDAGTYRQTQQIFIRTKVLRSTPKTAGAPLVTSVVDRSDAFAAGGLGTNAELILGALAAGPAMLSDLVAMTGLGKTTVFNNLIKMQDQSLVGQTGKRSPWALHDGVAASETEMKRQLTRVADETDQTYRQAAKRERMSRERAGWLEARGVKNKSA